MTALDRTWARDRRADGSGACRARRGSTPARAIASGTSPEHSTQPFKAPSTLTMAKIATTLPATDPSAGEIASAKGAALVAATLPGSRNSTARQAASVITPANRVPTKVASGTVRAGLRTLPAGNVAHSKPSIANVAIAATRGDAAGRDRHRDQLRRGVAAAEKHCCNDDRGDQRQQLERRRRQLQRARGPRAAHVDQRRRPLRRDGNGGRGDAAADAGHRGFRDRR